MILLKNVDFGFDMVLQMLKQILLFSGLVIAAFRDPEIKVMYLSFWNTGLHNKRKVVAPSCYVSVANSLREERC